jgi:hypothetical protein
MSKKTKLPKRSTYIAIDSENEQIIFIGDLDIVLDRVNEYIDEEEITAEEAKCRIDIFELGDIVDVQYKVQATAKLFY